MYSFLKERGRKIADELVGSEAYFTLTPSSFTLLQALRSLFQKYAGGRLLDVGAGRLAYRFLLKDYCTEYFSTDVSWKRGKIDFITDIQNMAIRRESFNTVFCTQVLEHIPEPGRAIDEIYRVLAPNGLLILSVPHLSHLHNKPDDYYRFTKYGLEHMLKQASFEILHMQPAGGLLSFLGFIPTTVLVNLFYGIPVLGSAAMFISKLLTRVFVFLDNRLEKRKIYALNYVVVAKKQ